MARKRVRGWDWHEARMAEGPPDTIKSRGAQTWDQLSDMCRDMTARWETWPAYLRTSYAFPNPEDRA